LAFLVDRYDIPTALVVNFDQTGMNIVPAANGARTWAEKGTKEVKLLGLDDKRQITGKIYCLASHLTSSAGI
jgi:hypothetical protein